MNKLDDLVIKELLRINEEGKVPNEVNSVEYKSFLDWNNKDAKAQYAKEIAALHFNGGYLIFGIDDNNNVIGLDESFNEPDGAHLADLLEKYFYPDIVFEQRQFTLNNKKLFIIYTPKYENSTPPICKKTYQNIIKESAIYKRNGTKSEEIGWLDLYELLTTKSDPGIEKIANQNALELKLKYQPIIKHGTGTHAHPSYISYKFINAGEFMFRTLTFENLKPDTTTVQFLPKDMYKGDFNVITVMPKNSGQPAHQLAWEVDIQIEDQLKNKYIQNIQSVGSRIKLSRLKEIDY